MTVIPSPDAPPPPRPDYDAIRASDVTIALGVYMGVNAKGAESIAPSIKR